MKRTLLAILAHPDDESFGPGGTFARYAAEGVDVHIAIATDGAAGSVAAGFEDSREKLAEVRAKELETAVNILGGTLHTLGYRDSGYIGDPANEHPEAFVQADEQESIGRIVRLIREIRPQIIITHDETGGYLHPDHIQCWKITVPAFYAAGDPQQFPSIGLAPYQPERLYFTAFPNTWVRFFIFLYRLRGKDPTKFGRNEDIDMTQVGIDRKKLHAFVDYRPFWEIKRAASAAHASQGGGGAQSRLPQWLQKLIFAKDTYIRAHPPAPAGFRENDLFGSVEN